MSQDIRRERLIARDCEALAGWMGDFLVKTNLIQVPWRRFTRDGVPLREYVSFTKGLRERKIAEGSANG